MYAVRLPAPSARTGSHDATPYLQPCSGDMRIRHIPRARLAAHRALTDLVEYSEHVHALREQDLYAHVAIMMPFTAVK